MIDNKILKDQKKRINIMGILNKNRSKITAGIMGFFLSALLILPFGAVSVHAVIPHVAVDVILVVDKSGSMSTNDAIGAEKTAAKAFIDKMDTTQDQVSIIPFSSSASTFQLTDNFTSAKTYVDSISATGGTDFLAALDAVQAEFASSRRKTGSMPVLIFMSDGGSYSDGSAAQKSVTDKTDALKLAGVQIFTIYLGSSSSSVLKKMASSTSGTDDHYYNTTDATTLTELYVSIAKKLQSLNIVYTGTYNGNLRLDASDLDPGKSVVLKVVGTVTIAGNQTNNPNNKGAGYKDISQLPQLVIIADKIIINRDVTNVDAWLITRGDGSIETCDDTTTLTTAKCNKQLVINGPVMTSHLKLMRTFGSGDGASSGQPAEILNLRADAYLWAAAHSIAYGRAQTVYTTELPPRF